MLDLAIIGGGPAGLAAGLYAARGGAKVTLFEALFPGGQAVKTHRIDNYPGFPDGVEGYELGEKLASQAQRFGLEIEYAEVQSLSLEGEIKTVALDGQVVEARAVLLSMGAKPRTLGLAREEALTGAGVSYCATCDGAFFREKDVAVVGGGDTAVSDALYLARFARKIYLVHRRDALRAAKVLQDAMFREEKIEPVFNSVPHALEGETKVTGLTVENVKTGDSRLLPVAAVFVAVGIEPATALVKDLLPLASSGAIETNARMETAIPGVYAAGDLRNTPLRQVLTACADGAIAATSALEYLVKHPIPAN